MSTGGVRARHKVDTGAMQLDVPGTGADFHLRQVAWFPCLVSSLYPFVSLCSTCQSLSNLDKLISRVPASNMASELTSAMTSRSLRIVRNVRPPRYLHVSK